MAPSIAGVAKSFFARQEDEKAKIDCDRPPGAMGTIPVTLLHPVFPRFLDDCETHEVTADDNAFALELSHTMSKFYEGENTRAEEIRRLFERWGVCFTVSTTDHGFTTDGDLDVNDHRYAIVEIKNEITSSGADPYNQGILYYLEWTRDTAKTLENTCLPCMLILLFGQCSAFMCVAPLHNLYVLLGPYVAFVGAAWNLRPTAEILSFVLPMHFHPSNTSMRLNVARHLVAFKRAVHTLGAYYQEITSVDISCPPQPQMFPYHTHFNYLEGGDTPQQGFEYTSQPIEDKLVFFATLPDMWEVCIKFVRHYSKDAHEACASLGCAPKLHAFETLPGGWFMVVMDKLAPEEYTTLWEVTPTKQSFDSIKNYLVQLHQKGYVHGDVRDTNIMVSKRDGTCMLVDFDWAGKIGDVQYPVNVSRDGIWRPSGAVDWQLILAEHDMAMLDHIHRRHGKNSVEMIRAESLDNSSS
ncbi:hypothetical protein HD554DRAFT_2195842 [Boletus coccyginus]|nr:hypothetical protein HD554DRAFT_2195842 [Boletus coccyginus]